MLTHRLARSRRRRCAPRTFHHFDAVLNSVHVLVRGVADGVAYQTFLKGEWSSGWCVASNASTDFGPRHTGEPLTTRVSYVTGKDRDVYFQRMTFEWDTTTRPMAEKRTSHSSH